jgi:hypothetical protein
LLDIAGLVSRARLGQPNPVVQSVLEELADNEAALVLVTPDALDIATPRYVLLVLICVRVRGVPDRIRVLNPSRGDWRQCGLLHEELANAVVQLLRLESALSANDRNTLASITSLATQATRPAVSSRFVVSDASFLSSVLVAADVFSELASLRSTIDLVPDSDARLDVSASQTISVKCAALQSAIVAAALTRFALLVTDHLH